MREAAKRCRHVAAARYPLRKWTCVTGASNAVGSGCASRVTRVALFKGAVEIRRPGDSVRALDSGAEENVM
jgi:hypothetical protein